MNKMIDFELNTNVKKGIITVVLFIFFVISVKCIKDNVSVANAETQRELYYTSVCVQENDSLWSIASEYYTDEFNSVPELISAIKDLNNMGSDKIDAGNNILIPYYKK